MDTTETLRRAEIGAAIGATGIVGAALVPFLERFATPLARRVTYGTGARLDTLRVETVLSDAEDLLGWIDLLRDVYGLSADNALLVETLGLRLATGRVAVAVTEGRASSVPALDFAFVDPGTSGAVYPLLKAAGVVGAPLEAWDTMLGRLGRRDVARFGIRLDDPLAAPRFRTTLRAGFDLGERADFQGRLDHALETVGTSKAQRGWLGAMIGAFAPRPRNEVEVAVSVRRDGLDPWLQIGFPDVPARLVLKLLVQFGRAPDAGARLGALTAAAGRLGDDAPIDRLHLVGWNGEPPGVGFEIVCGPPLTPAV